MNGQRLMVGLFLFILIFLCLTQTAATGCAKASSASAEALVNGSNGSFDHDSAARAQAEPSNWLPVSDKVLSQIKVMYEAVGPAIVELQQSGSGAPAMRCVLRDREGVSEKRELLDGLLLLHQTFPEQRVYLVEITGKAGQAVQASWEDLMALDRAGYSFETPAEEVQAFWRDLFSDAEMVGPPEKDDLVLIETATD